MRVFKECYLYPFAVKELNPSAPSTPNIKKSQQAYDDLTTVYEPTVKSEDILTAVKGYVQGTNKTSYKVRAKLMSLLNYNANALLQIMISNYDNALLEDALSNPSPFHVPVSEKNAGIYYFLKNLGNYMITTMIWMLAQRPTGFQIVQGTKTEIHEDGLNKQKIITTRIDPRIYGLSPEADVSDELNILKWEPLLKVAPVKELGDQNIVEI
jgi:hypothetical protein